MSNNSSNKTAVPEAKSAMNRFKFEVANELEKQMSGNMGSMNAGSMGTSKF